MPPKSNVRSKTVDKSKTVDQAKTDTSNKSEQMLLVRDDKTELLMIVETTKATLANKASKLRPGVTVSWQNNERERWRGKVLHIGSELECKKMMNTIEKNLETNNTDMVQSKKKGGDKLQSTIIIERNVPEDMAMDHDQDEEEEDANQQPLHSSNEEENEQDVGSNQHSTTGSSAMPITSQGDKRKFDDHVENPNKPTPKRSKHGLTVPYSMYSAKEQECLALQAEVNKYQQEWMPRPQHPAVIEFFVDITNIVTDKPVHDGEEEDMETVFNVILTNLNMSENQLKSCHGRTATKTARRLMKFKYPHPSVDFKFTSIAKDIVDAIIRYTRIANPTDRTGDAEIKHAMGNYIATSAFQTRARNSVVSNDVPEEEDMDD